MAKKYDSKYWKEQLTKRTSESEDRKEGEIDSKYFIDDLDVPFAKFGVTKDEPHIIDVIPFLTGNKMPNFMRIGEDKPAYYLDIYVHQNIGGSKAWIVCPLKNYGDPCPICEHIDDLSRDGKSYEDFADIYVKRRCVYNVINMSSTKEEKKGIQIWEVSYKYSEKQLLAAAKNPRGGGSIPFAHTEKDLGHSISFSVENDTYRTISGYKLVPRDYDIDYDLIEKAKQLDQIIKVLSYKQIEKIFHRASEVDSNPAKEKEDDVPDHLGEEEPTPKSRPRKLICPEKDGVLGKDIDQFDRCDDCELYSECAEEADKIEEERKAKREERTKVTRRR